MGEQPNFIDRLKWLNAQCITHCSASGYNEKVAAFYDQVQVLTHEIGMYLIYMKADPCRDEKYSEKVHALYEKAAQLGLNFVEP